jgi:hypothetical protein
MFVLLSFCPSCAAFVVEMSAQDVYRKLTHVQFNEYDDNLVQKYALIIVSFR